MVIKYNFYKIYHIFTLFYKQYQYDYIVQIKTKRNEL